MPTYEYRCDSCNTNMEITHSITADAHTKCPNCDSETLKRLISSTSFRLEGSTWAHDGYRNRNLRRK